MFIPNKESKKKNIKEIKLNYIISYRDRLKTEIKSNYE